MEQPAPIRYERILVTGGTGFVGGHLCPRLVAAWPHAERLMLTRPGEEIRRAGFVPAVTDLLDRTAVAGVIARFRPDLVVHLAAQSSVGALGGNAAEAARINGATWQVNVEASLHIASALAAHAPVATVLFASSAEVYGASFNDGPADETTPPRPMNAYARSKLAAELALADMLPCDAKLLVARAFNHTGAGQDTRFVLPAFAAQIGAIEAGLAAPRLMVGNLDAERDFLDVSDVCDAYLAMLHTPRARLRETVHIASGSACRIGDLLETMRSMSPAQFDVSVDPDRMRPSEVRRVAGSADQLARPDGLGAARADRHDAAGSARRAASADCRAARLLSGEPDAMRESAKDERIRLLEYQAEFLRRELSVVAKRHHDIVYSAVFVISLPLRLLEQFAHTIMRASRAVRAKLLPRRPTSTRVSRRAIVEPDPRGLERAIASGISAKMGRHFAGR